MHLAVEVPTRRAKLKRGFSLGTLGFQENLLPEATTSNGAQPPQIQGGGSPFRELS